jgi:hypothetical protein
VRDIVGGFEAARRVLQPTVQQGDSICVAGDLTADSQAGRGARFTLTLPALDGDGDSP